MFKQQLYNTKQYLRIFFFHFSYADEVSVGDEVLVYEKNRLVPGKVQNISTFLMKGM